MKNPILELSFAFALKIVAYCELLEKQKKFIIANQLLKSGTSIGANIREAQNPHSRADFIAKMIIAMKEADETSYWLDLCQKSNNYPDPLELQINVKEIIRLLSKIISTSKQHQN
ncbi:MAG: four helix bundle protein [Saprospiraceae bacterium]|nr:four helix bundle protein [Saprospiraceae bacterium]HRG68692.1 four helix bundle protein [Saprospiraceae bacterium]